MFLTHELHAEYCEISSIHMVVDYKPKRVDYQRLQEGGFVELLNFFHLDGASLTLKNLRLTGVRHLSAKLIFG